MCPAAADCSRDTVFKNSPVQSLVPGTFCSCCYGNNIEGLSSDIAMDVLQNTSAIGPKKSFERDWKEIRQRLERKIAAAAAQAISGRPGGAEIRKPRWATPPKQKEPRYYQVKQEDKLTTRGANPRTGVPSPSNCTDSSCEDRGPRPRVSQKWKVNGDQWVSVDVSQTPSPQSSPLSYKLAKTLSSAGSGSTDISSSDDWEDRFVVHMPSANDPNPPSMSIEQIRMYQEKIGKLHTYTVKRHEMDATKPSSGSPKSRNVSQPKKASSIPILQNESSFHSPSTVSSQSISPPVDGPKQSYFSPDEVGRARVSPVNDSPKLKQKELIKRLREEGFLGCMGIDEAGAKNPDEILMFPNLEDETEPPASPTVKEKDEGDKGKPSSIPRAPRTSKPSGQPLARAAAKKAVGKQHVASRTSPLVIPETLTAAPATKIPKPATSESKTSPTSKESEKNSPTSALPVAATTKKPANKAVRTRLAFKPSPKTRKLPKESSDTSPESDLFFQRTPPSSPPDIGHAGSDEDAQEQPAKSTSPDLDQKSHQQILDKAAISTSESDDTLRLSASDIFKDIPRKGPQLHEILSPAEVRARNTYFAANHKSPKTPSVAELDGHQVPQQLPSPPLSASPSPPLRAKAEISPVDVKRPQNEKRTTHSIRMEIRMKAEKAKQGAAAAKSASERLAAARQHAERLAEARAAFDKAKAQSTARKTSEPTEEQKLNTQKINEARIAYKAAKAREEAQKQEKSRQNEAQAKSTTLNGSTATFAPGSQSIPANDTNPKRKPPRKGGAKRAPTPQDSKHEQEDVTITHTAELKDSVDISNDADPAGIALRSGTFYLSLASLYDIVHHNQVYSHALFYCESLFHMATHCFKVCRRLAEAWLEYKQNGVLPQSCVDDFGQLASDIGQALVNFAVLYFVLMVIIKATGYVVIVTNWLVWLSRPVGWVFGHILGVVCE